MLKLQPACHYLTISIYCFYNIYGFSITMVKGILGPVLDVRNRSAVAL